MVEPVESYRCRRCEALVVGDLNDAETHEFTVPGFFVPDGFVYVERIRSEEASNFYLARDSRHATNSELIISEDFSNPEYHSPFFDEHSYAFNNFGSLVIVRNPKIRNSQYLFEGLRDNELYVPTPIELDQFLRGYGDIDEDHLRESNEINFHTDSLASIHRI